MSHFAQAQDDMQLPDGALFIFWGQGTYMLDPFAFQWLPDADSLFFHLIPVEGVPLSAFRYAISTNTVQSVVNLPTQIILTAAQREAFSATSWIAYPSPDGRYAVYTIQKTSCGEDPDCVPLLGLVNLETGAYTRVQKGSDDGYTVRWSTDSSAFLVVDTGEYGGVGGVYYGAVAQINDEPDAHLTLLMNYSAGDIGFVDISRDGYRVLVREIWDGYKTGLILWDARTATSEAQFAARADGRFILDDEVITGASFIPDDDQHILAIIECGLVRYDLDTGEIEVLDPDINSQWVAWAYVSPDTRYVATYSQLLNEGGGRGQIALYPVGNR